MTDLPELTVCLLTFKRPWYATLTLNLLLHRINYSGAIKYHIADGGSPIEELRAYEQILGKTRHTISVTDNLADMINSCARASGDVWFMTLDDFMPERPINLTPDVRFIQQNGDVGMIRMGRLAFWESDGENTINAQLRGLGGLHWWVLNKDTQHKFVCAVNTTLYHRRFWDCYGDIPTCPPNMPGKAETDGASRFNDKLDGVKVALPMRFGEDSFEMQEPMWHYGTWRTDEYALNRSQGHYG